MRTGLLFDCHATLWLNFRSEICGGLASILSKNDVTYYWSLLVVGVGGMGNTEGDLEWRFLTLIAVGFLPTPTVRFIWYAL